MLGRVCGQGRSARSVRNPDQSGTGSGPFRTAVRLKARLTVAKGIPCVTRCCSGLVDRFPVGTSGRRRRNARLSTRKRKVR